MICWAGPLLAAIMVAAPVPGGDSDPATGPAIAPPPAPLKLLPAPRPTPAQRVMPGLH